MAKGANNVSKKRLGSSKPYDVSNSFVKQVADRVSNLLPQTSWLNRWLLPTSSNAEDTNFVSNPVGSEDGDITTGQPPPLKRARIPLHQSFSAESFQVSKPSLRNESVEAISKQSLGCFEDDRQEAGPSGLSSFPRSLLVSSTPATQAHTVPTHSHTDQLSPITNGDDRSDSGESTSGCSSLVPQGTRQSFNNESADHSINVKRASVDERDFSTYLQSSRIFPNRTTPSLHLNSSNSRQGPSFNASLYTLPFSTRSPSIDKSFTSNFYPGPTTYGGASAIRKPRNGFFSPSEMLPITQSIQVKPINRSDSSELSSVTARRILDTLDELSSPVRDAKRVPLMSPATRKRKADTTMPGPPTQDLTIPTVPDLLKLHRRMKLQDSLESARLIASSSGGIQNPVSSEYQLKLQKEATKHTGKITSRRKQLIESPHQDVQLPNIALPLSSLPKFDFFLQEPPLQGFNLNRAADISFITDKLVPVATPIDNNKTKTSSSAKHFTLTNVPVTQAPIVSSINFIPSCPSKVNTPFSQTRLKEKPKIMRPAEGNGPVESTGFGITIAGELKSGSVMDILGKPNRTFSVKPLSQPSESTIKSSSDSWECNTCLVRNKVEVSQCMSCKTPRSMSKAPVSSTKSVVTPSQSVITTSKAPVVIPSFGSQFKLPTGTWVCNSCMVQNKPEATVCIACTVAKPGSKPAQKVETSVSFDKKFLPGSDTWECATCMVRNKINLEYCAACESKKPGSVNNLPVAKPFSGFGNMFKKPEGSWECPDCMVVNKEVVKCVACGASKPGSAKTSTDNTVASKATSGFNAVTTKVTSGFTAVTPTVTSDSTTVTSNTTSGFGDMFKLPEGSWECPDCMLVNKDAWKCVACEATKPGIPGFGDMFKPAEGSWECPVCMVSNKNTLKCVACEAPKPGTEKPESPMPATKFNFKIPPEANSFKFGVDKAGITTNVVDTVAPSKPATPNFKFGASPSTVATSGFTFGTPITTTSSTNTTGFTFGSSNSLSKTSIPDTTPALFTFGIPPAEKKPTVEQTESEKVTPSKTESIISESKDKVDGVPLSKIVAQPTFSFGSIKSDEPAKLNASATSFKFGAPSSTSSIGEPSVKLNGPSTPSTVIATAAISTSSTTPSFGSVTTSNVPVTSSQTVFGTSKPSPLFGGFTPSQPSFGQPPASSALPSGTAFNAQSKPNTSFNFVPPAAVGQKRSCNDDDDRISGGKKQASEFAPLAGKPSGNIFGSVANTTCATVSSTSAPSVLSFGSGTKTADTGFKNSVIPSFGSTFASKATEIILEKPVSSSSTPFVFGASASGGAPASLSFSAAKQPVSSPSNMFSFGASATPAPGGFAFSGQATEKPSSGFSFGSTPASFGNVPAGAPVFGSAPAPQPTPSAGFNFGASSQQVPTSSVFSFTKPVAVPVYAFGQNAAPAPTFDPNARPSFNFTGGEVTQFTAAGASIQPSPTVRRIKKAVRRTPR